jgi:hypothetical protein
VFGVQYQAHNGGAASSTLAPLKISVDREMMVDAKDLDALLHFAIMLIGHCGFQRRAVVSQSDDDDIGPSGRDWVSILWQQVLVPPTVVAVTTVLNALLFVWSDGAISKSASLDSRYDQRKLAARVLLQQVDVLSKQPVVWRHPLGKSQLDEMNYKDEREKHVSAAVQAQLKLEGILDQSSTATVPVVSAISEESASQLRRNLVDAISRHDERDEQDFLGKKSAFFPVMSSTWCALLKNVDGIIKKNQSLWFGLIFEIEGKEATLGLESDRSVLDQAILEGFSMLPTDVSAWGVHYEKPTDGRIVGKDVAAPLVKKLATAIAIDNSARCLHMLCSLFVSHTALINDFLTPETLSVETLIEHIIKQLIKDESPTTEPVEPFKSDYGPLAPSGEIK